MEEMSLDLKKCINCLECVGVCCEKCIKDIPGVGLVFNFKGCVLCKKCVNICPEGAITVKETPNIKESYEEMRAL